MCGPGSQIRHDREGARALAAALRPSLTSLVLKGARARAGLCVSVRVFAGGVCMHVCVRVCVRYKKTQVLGELLECGELRGGRRMPNGRALGWGNGSAQARHQPVGLHEISLIIENYTKFLADVTGKQVIDVWLCTSPRS